MILGDREAVLVAIDGLTIDRVLPTPGRIAGATRSKLSPLDVLTHVNALTRDGFLTTKDDGVCVYSALTDRGREWTANIYARGSA
jgi:hypothetical protein